MKPISRRKFVKDTIKVTAAASILAPEMLNASPAEVTAPYLFTQVTLPYAFNGLEPNIDAMTMEIHYTKHHAAYIKNVNEEIAAGKFFYESEKDFFTNASKLSPKARNNAGGAWNHNFFWQIMKPNGGGNPTGKISDAINGAFGSFEKFKEEFTKAAMGRFGSGWAWLVSHDGKLSIGSTANQDNPMMDSTEFKGKPILGIDVWEHAYYLKYQNKRNEYVANWWNTVNWDEAAKHLN
jgi:Fe-Mn family superoxide dismutase